METVDFQFRSTFDDQNKIIIGDALNELRQLESESVQSCITSPPYFGLRNYNVQGQIGQEATLGDYIGGLTNVFEEVRRILKKDGTFWLNLGDSYCGSWSGSSMRPKGGSQRDGKPGFQTKMMDSRYSSRGGYVPDGLKPKDLMGVPWRVAFSLQSAGWWLRQDIIWQKPNCLPESVKDRCTKSHEYIFLLSKSGKYFFDHEAIKEPALCGSKGSEFHLGKTGEHQLGRAQKIRPAKAKGSFIAKGEPLPGQLPFRAIVEMRNKRSVWSVSTTPYQEAHFATFPTALIVPCILAGSKPGDVILDPFFGAGTTGLAAMQNNRRFIGIELNPEYAELAKKRLTHRQP